MTPGVVWAEIDAATVQRSIDRGIAFLRKTQDPRGNWAEFASFPGGVTSLCTLAMLSAGVPKSDPQIAASLRELRQMQPDRTYTIALQTLVFCEVGSAADLPLIRRNVDLLCRYQNAAGSWGYDENRGSGDPSNAQFALLALGAAVDRGVNVDSAVFEKALQQWTATQRQNGGWTYMRSEPTPSGSMTCAGIASVVIAQGRLDGGTSAIRGDQILCCGNADLEREPIAAALNYLGSVFSASVNPGGGDGTYFYYMYALERAGRLTGRRFIGGHDWYREGAERLVALQDSFEGYWRGGGQAESDPDIATAFALLFLSKGKRQVVVAKLNHDTRPIPGDGPAGSADWNHHPDGLNQLVRHTQRDWGRDLTWQTIDLTSATLADLVQTPVIVVSGREALSFTPAHAELVKAYVDQGGTLVFEADGGDGCGDATAFLQSVRRWCDRWYPDAPLERLPPTHPVWYAQRRVDPAALGNEFWVDGVQACCRTPIFVIPNSLSCRWELSGGLFFDRPIPPAAKNQLQAAVTLGENILAYATGRELKDKLDQPMLLQGGIQAAGTRGVLSVGQVPVGAGGEDARRALPHAVSLIAGRLPIAIAAADQPIAIEPAALADVAVLWIHGRREFTLTPAQRTVIGDFLDRGGFIIANAICGSPAFAESFRQEMAAIDPRWTLSPLPAKHAALTNRFGGFDVRNVTLRTPAGSGKSQTINRQSSHPLLEFGRRDDLTQVFLSPVDLSCALESQNSVQCPGYSTDETARIVANLILYLMNQSLR